MKGAFIGLRHMGAPVAPRLVKAGDDVMVYDRSREKAEAIERNGADIKIAGQVSGACEGDELTTMWSDDAVEIDIFGNSRVVHSLGRNSIDVCAGTISGALSDKLTEAHRKVGHGCVAAYAPGNCRGGRRYHPDTDCKINTGSFDRGRCLWSWSFRLVRTRTARSAAGGN